MLPAVKQGFGPEPQALNLHSRSRSALIPTAALRDDQGDRVATNWRNPLCRNWQRPLGVRKSTKVEDDQESQHDSAPDDESSSPDSFGSGNSQAFAEESFRARIGH